MKRALITGITGQDGSYLAELLLEKGYEVHGLIRRASSFNTGRIDHIFDQLHLHHGDMTDGSCLRHILAESEPDEIYNLAAQSHVAVSFECPEYTLDTIVMGTLRLLEAVRDMDSRPRVYQASTSEMYGQVSGIQCESTPFYPVSPYGVAKLAAHRLAVLYREAYEVPVSCGILFNHESPRRGETFVTRKVCKAAARISRGLQDHLDLGNLGARRDWGWAPDYVEAMWLMLQAHPDDFVIATGESHSIKDLCARAFGAVGLRWVDHVRHVERLERPLDVPHLQGNATKASVLLGWRPTVSFQEMIGRMVAWELAEAIKEAGA